MKEIVDLVIIVDTVGVLNDRPEPSLDPDAPIEVPAEACFLVGPASRVQSGQASAKLELAEFEGALRWSARPASREAGHWVVLWHVSPSDECLSDGSPFVQSLTHLIPVIEDCKSTEKLVEGSAHWHGVITEVVASGEEQPAVDFCITKQDRSTGKPVAVGYFRWCPHLRLMRPPIVAA